MKAKLLRESLNEGFTTEEGRNIDKIASMLGYDDFHEFLGDNPGCYEAITKWIDEYFSDQLATEQYEPEELERLNLYTAAEKIREDEDDEDDEDDDEDNKPPANIKPPPKSPPNIKLN